MSVRLGRLEGSAGMHAQGSGGQCPFKSVQDGTKGGAKKLEGGFAGFRVGIKSFVDDYKARAIHGRGMNTGVTADGELFIGKVQVPAPRVDIDQDLRIELQARPSGNGYAMRLRAEDQKGRTLGETKRQVPGAWQATASACRNNLSGICRQGDLFADPAVAHPLPVIFGSLPAQLLRFPFGNGNSGMPIRLHESVAHKSGPVVEDVDSIGPDLPKDLHCCGGIEVDEPFCNGRF